MKHLWTNYIKPLAIWLLQGVIGAAIVLFFAFMFVEWASGCGETYVDSKGKVHINECTFTTPRKDTI